MKEIRIAYDENGKEIIVEGYFVTSDELGKLMQEYLVDNYDGFVSNNVSYLETKLSGSSKYYGLKSQNKLETVQQDKLKEIRKTLHLRIHEINVTLNTIRKIRDSKECSFKSLQDDMYDCEETFNARMEELEDILKYVDSLIFNFKSPGVYFREID